MSARGGFEAGRRLGLFALAAAAVLAPLALVAQGAAPAAPKQAQPAAARHDGQHDFDFLLGSWKYHLSKLDRPLTGSKKWDEFEGKGRCRPVWSGAEIDQLEADAPGQHIEGLALRMYNPESHQWSIYWGTRQAGTLAMPPTVGSFDPAKGRGEFYDDEVWHGRAIKVRYLWLNVKTQAPRFEEAFSTDGGKTWETNWITTQTRVADGASR